MFEKYRNTCDNKLNCENGRKKIKTSFLLILDKKNSTSTRRRKSKTDSKQLPTPINVPVTFHPPPSRSDVVRREYDRQRMELQSSGGLSADTRPRELTAPGRSAPRQKKTSPKSER